MYHIYINITGQCSKGAAPSVSHPPIPLYNHLTLPRSLTWLPNIPLSLDSQTTGLSSGPASPQTGGWLRFLGEDSLAPSTLALTPQSKWAEVTGRHTFSSHRSQSFLPSSSTTDGCGRIRGRIAQLSQDRPPPPLRSPMKSGDQMLYISLSLQPPWNCYTHPCWSQETEARLCTVCVIKTEMELKAISSWNPP